MIIRPFSGPDFFRRDSDETGTKKRFLVLGRWISFISCSLLAGTSTTSECPLYDDILSFLPLLQTWGSAAAWLFTLHFILTISIPASMVLFWRQSRYAPWLAYAQTPLRLAFMLPSLSLVVWLAQAVALKSAAFFIALLLVSEAAKVVTLWRCRKV